MDRLLTEKSISMELKIDLLLKEKKSAVRVILGIIFLVISAIYAAIHFINTQPIKTFDWFFFMVMALNGVVHIIGGFGLPLIRLLGESYILINEQKITLKKRVLGKERSILWVDIKMINYKLNRFKIIKTNDTTLTLDFSELEYLVLEESKKIIGKLAEAKGVPINVY